MARDFLKKSVFIGIFFYCILSEAATIIVRFLRNGNYHFLFFLFLFLNLLFGSIFSHILISFLFFLLLLFFSKSVAFSTWFTYLSVFFLNKSIYFSQPFIYGGTSYSYTIFFSLADFYLFICFGKLFAYKKLDAPLSLKLGLALFAVFSLATIFSLTPSVSVFHLYLVLKFFIAVIVSYSLFSQSKYAKTSLKLVTIMLLLNALLIGMQKINGAPLGLTIENFFTPYGRFSDENIFLYRPSGIFWDPNLAASVMLMWFPFLFIVVPSFLRERILKPKLLLAIAIIGLAIFFTSSRAVILFFCFILTALVLKHPTYFMRTFRKYTRIIFMGLAILSLVAAPILLIRFHTFSQFFSTEGGGGYRYKQLLDVQKITSIYPLGIGLNVFPGYVVMSPGSSRDFVSPHNIFGEVAASAGLSALILYCLFWVAVFSESFNSISKKNLNLQFFISLSLLGYLFVGQFYPWFFSNVIMYLLATILGYHYAHSYKKYS